MAAGFFISKSVGIVGIVLALAAAATIIALAVVYAQEKNKATSTDTDGTTTTATTTAAPTTTASSNAWDQWRLPTTLLPESYEVTLQPFLTPDDNDMYIFKGNSSVIFVCVEATDLILIHSNELNYTLQDSFLTSLEAVDGSSVPSISATWLETTTQYLVVQLDGPLEQGQRYRLFSIFTGELADDLAGFYRSEYTDEQGENKVVATTQMEPTDARKAFPCFDEPAMKANFTVTLIHPSDHGAISNMPVRSTRQQEIDGEMWNVTEFETTPKMSTYLVAFIVSQFSNVQNVSEDVLIRIWGRPEAIAEGQGSYALEVTGPILNFFEKHYNTSYPLPKSDQVGLPDFNAGAMENWGLVTYRENSLLFDSVYSSISNRERVVTVIAHELAHQWFGNLVTLRWWNDLWLNEGFASYVEYLGADSAEPSWNIKDLMVLNEVYTVMATDALTTSHPLSFSEDEINTPDEISEVFDTIAYSKGASVLRMLSDFLTEDVFKSGLQTYLHTFAYGNTVYTDLWSHLQQAVNESSVSLPSSISNIMDRWTLQMGFPVVTVNTLNGSVSQNHFLLDPNATVETTSDFNYTWIVPITWMTSETTGDRYWLTSVSGMAHPARAGSGGLAATSPAPAGVKVPWGGTGGWGGSCGRPFSPPLRHQRGFPGEQPQLAPAEPERQWCCSLGARLDLQGPPDHTGTVTPVCACGLALASWCLAAVCWSPAPRGPSLPRYNEMNAINTACSYGITECQELATSYFNQWQQNVSNNPIPPNLRSAIYRSVVATGGEDAWDFIWERFEEATVTSEADRLRIALTCSPHPWILNRWVRGPGWVLWLCPCRSLTQQRPPRYLQYTLDSTKIRRQDATSTINNIASNVVGQPLAWDFIRANWRKIFTQYGSGSFSFSSLITAVTQRFSTEFELQQLEQFKADNEDIGFGSGTRALEQALEKTQTNINWVQTNQDAVMAWFQSEIASS
ncbi:AMPN Aminopeptidase, partial [Corythaeola cristata]|nr:AMPN Aminopeptidase [Corythaeola cristata]